MVWVVCVCGGTCHVKAVLGGVWKRALQSVSSAARFPSLSRVREPFRQQIMMQNAVPFACAVSPSFLNCAILLVAVELLSFQQTSCAGKLLCCCQAASST